MTTSSSNGATTRTCERTLDTSAAEAIRTAKVERQLARGRKKWTDVPSAVGAGSGENAIGRSEVGTG